jgi:hypothetical protein
VLVARRSKLACLAIGAALGGVGCLEATPPPVSGWVYDGAGAVPPDAGASERDLDATPADLAPFETDPGDGGAASWAGHWTFVSGSSGVNCGGSFSVTASSGFMVITPAPAGDLLTVQINGCSFTFALVGDTATTAPPDQACAAWAIPTIPIWTLTMKPDGTLQEKVGGQIWLNGQACMLSGTSTLVRQ